MTMMRTACALGVILVLSGCASVTSVAQRIVPGDPSALPGCRNLTASDRRDARPDGYDTTWNSSLQEGALEGAASGLDEGGGIGATLLRPIMVRRAPTREGNRIFNHRNEDPMPYCRAFAADADQVKRAVEAAITALDHPTGTRDRATGIYRTGWRERRDWRDSYLVTVETAGPDRSIVRIWRSVYISRSPNTYNQGESAGGNETWMFTRIAERLGG